jgi:hypothetical protein
MSHAWARLSGPTLLALLGCGESPPARTASPPSSAAASPTPAGAAGGAPATAGPSSAPVPLTVTGELPCKDGARVTDIAATEATACAAVEGRVACWGEVERLKAGAKKGKSPPVWVDGPPNIRKVATSGGYLLGVDGSDALWAWDQRTPPVKLATSVANVVMSETSVCLLTKDGEARCFNERRDTAGSLDHPSATSRDVVELALGGAQWCARKRDGAVVCQYWLRNRSTERPAPSFQPTADAGGLFVDYEDACVLKTSGPAQCSNEYLAANSFFGREPRFATTGWRDARSGSCLVDGSGEVVCGMSSDGTPMQTVLVGRAPDQLVMGRHFACARCGEAVSCWGEASTVWLARDTAFRSATAVPGLDDAIDLDVAGSGSCAVRRSGKLRCWGPAAGPGGGFEGDETRLPETMASERAAARAALAGPTFRDGRSSCTLHDGVVSCEGENDIGQLGRPAAPTRARQKSAPVPGLGKVLQLAAAGGHFCARMRDGVACWGKGVAPPQSFAFEEPREVAVNGVGDVCVVAKDGTVHCAHFGPHYSPLQYDLLGTDDKKLRSVPAIAGARHVRVGLSHACVLHDSGRVSCFGSPLGNRLGDGGTFVSKPFVIEMPKPP